MRRLLTPSGYFRNARIFNTSHRAHHRCISGISDAPGVNAIPLSEKPPLRYIPDTNPWNLSQAFKLRPLSTDTCTRVLTINPSSDPSTPVSLDIEEIDLAGEYIPFVAISHVWGSNPIYDRPTICAGKPRYVTRRVDSLLHRIRNKISGDDQRYRQWARVWIDTLCIDQADDVLARREKNHQVSIMHKIFGDAQEVVVDLGAADRYSYLLPSVKDDIVLLRQKALDDEYCKDILGFPSSVKVEAEEAQRIRRSLEACSRLLDKQWMCRMWTVQEYALARKCTFLSGNIVIDGDLLNELGKLASHANINGRSHLSMLFSRFRRALALAKLPQLAAIQDQGSTKTKQLGFAESLGLGWHHDCTDERDTVYALRALVDYGGTPLYVDYNEPSELLARRVSEKLVELGSHEAVLAGARGVLDAPGVTNAPSWSFLMRPSFKFVGEERHWILSGKPNRFQAGGPQRTDINPRPLRLISSDHLEADIHHIGTVSTLSDQVPSIPQYGANPKLPVERLYTYNTERTIHTRAVIIDAWLRHILPSLNRGRKQMKHLDRRSSEVWTTITHGHNSMEFDVQMDPTDTQRRIDHWLMLIDMSLKGLEDLGYQSHYYTSTLKSKIRALEEAMRKRHLLLAELVQKPQEWIDEVHHEFDLSGDPKLRGVARLLSKANSFPERSKLSANATWDRTRLPNEQLLKQVALNTYLVNEAFDISKVRAMDQLKMLERRLGVLDDGRLISVPGLAEAGDIVAVIQGISVPYVLRGFGKGEFKIVGMAYLKDVMHGEAVRENTDWQAIHIV